jgi:hypothetical protein
MFDRAEGDKFAVEHGGLLMDVMWAEYITPCAALPA